MIALLMAALLLGVCACTSIHADQSEKDNLTWQEQYDLGVRYLSEGNYEEAIIAFTAAIEIDPKQALAYVGRGDAYVASGETEENLTVAQADYERAIELDETLVGVYLSLANLYIRQGKLENALEILRQGIERIDHNQELEERIDEIEIVAENARIFTANILKPEDLRLNGKPFWEATIEEFEAINPSDPSEIMETGIYPFGDKRTYMQYLQLPDEFFCTNVSAQQKNGDAGLDLVIYNVSENLKGVEPLIDIRNIQWWDSCAVVLSKLGLQESWIESFMALGPGEDIVLRFDGKRWETNFEMTVSNEAGDFAIRSIYFVWDTFACDTVNDTEMLEFEMSFDKSDKLDRIVLSTY